MAFVYILFPIIITNRRDERKSMKDWDGDGDGDGDHIEDVILYSKVVRFSGMMADVAFYTI